jgi:TatA/E family protein of Tat protein translocase
MPGWEWLIIGVIAVVIILWGPSKIPEFARALGRARGVAYAEKHLCSIP